MIEATNPVQNSEQINSVRVKKFVKHLIIAAQKKAEKEKAKQGLEKQFEKLKTSAGKRVKKETLAKEIKKLQKKIDEVIKHETNLISTEKKKAAQNQALSEEVKKLQYQIKELKKKDVHVIETLINQIKEMEDELRITEQARVKEETENKMELDAMGQGIFEIRERLKQSAMQKAERDKRVAAIEARIKEKVSKNYDEIVKLEHNLSLMEGKYEKIRNQGKYDSDTLKEFEDRVKTIKQRLIMRRAGIGEEETQFIPTIRKKIEEKKPKLILKKRIIPSAPIKFVKHDIQIEPVEERPEPMMSGKIPQLPPGPPSQLKLEKIPKKRSLMKRLLTKKSSIPPPPPKFK